MENILQFGSDQAPGIRRTGTKRFAYVHDDGRRASPEDLERIRKLVIPPAWTKVWIAADPWSHLQATGRDAKGRKQYRYHEVFTADQAANKFADLVPFGHALGPLRRRVRKDLARTDLSHAHVCATLVRLLDITSLRIGNEEYSRTNESFGLTTLLNDHARVRGSTIHLAFRGKSRHDFDVHVGDARLARIVRRCQDLPGQRLFEYRDDFGQVRTVGSSDVNAYLSEHAAPGFTAKTFRTWNATVRAGQGLADASAHVDLPSKKVLNEVIDDVAGHLGNTRAVCRNSYIHPAVIEAYVDGSLAKRWQRPVAAGPSGLTVSERRALRLVRAAGRAQRLAS